MIKAIIHKGVLIVGVPKVWIRKGIPGHSSSSIYPPDAQGVEALYNEVAPPGVIPEWKRPTGAHNAYAIGDKVTYKGQTWESKIAGNTTVPDRDVPYNRYWKQIN